MTQSTTDCKINLTLKNIAQTKKAKSYKLGQSAAQMRPRTKALMEVYGYDQITNYKPKIKSNS